LGYFVLALIDGVLNTVLDDPAIQTLAAIEAAPQKSVVTRKADPFANEEPLAACAVHDQSP